MTKSEGRNKNHASHAIRHHEAFYLDGETWLDATVLYEEDETSLEKYLLAQYFAFVLLMPVDVFSAVVKSATYKGKCFIGEVADWFGLPMPVVMERGRMLGML